MSRQNKRKTSAIKVNYIVFDDINIYNKLLDLARKEKLGISSYCNIIINNFVKEEYGLSDEDLKYSQTRVNTIPFAKGNANGVISLLWDSLVSRKKVFLESRKERIAVATFLKNILIDYLKKSNYL